MRVHCAVFGMVVAFGGSEVTGCSRKVEEVGRVSAGSTPSQPPVPSVVPVSSVSPTALGARNPGHELAGHELEWQEPTGWKKAASPGMMRKATYEIPPASGDTEPGELGVFYFGPGQGGPVEANIRRWTDQFSEVSLPSIQRSERTVRGLVQYLVEIERGTYTNSMALRGPAGPRKNFGLLGAIVEGPGGSYFFKLTGPSATVRQNRAAYFEMLDSMRLKTN